MAKVILTVGVPERTPSAKLNQLESMDGFPTSQRYHRHNWMQIGHCNPNQGLWVVIKNNDRLKDGDVEGGTELPPELLAQTVYSVVVMLI